MLHAWSNLPMELRVLTEGDTLEVYLEDGPYHVNEKIIYIERERKSSL